MIECAVRIGAANWKAWLRHVADTRALRALEVSAELLEAEYPVIHDLLEKLGLSVLHVPDVVPPNVGRFFAESPFPDFPGALQSLRRGMSRHWRCEARVVSIDLALDRMELSGVEEGLRRRVALLRSLLTDMEDLGVAPGLRVRLPRPFPGSHAWEWAGNILHELGSERCSLVLDMVLGDVEADFDPNEAIRSCASHLSLVRFFYRPNKEDRPTDAMHAAWAEALRSYSTASAVVFYPAPCRREQLAAAVRDMERWREIYGG